MEPWCVEVKGGEVLKVTPGNGKVLHITKASLGVVQKNGNMPVFLSVIIDGEVENITTLHRVKQTVYYNRTYEKEIRLAHNLKNGTICFHGYKTRICHSSIAFDESTGKHEDKREDDCFGQGKPRTKISKASRSKLECKAEVVSPGETVLINIQDLLQDCKDLKVEDVLYDLRVQVRALFGILDDRVKVLEAEKIKPIDEAITTIKETIKYLKNKVGELNGKKRRRVTPGDGQACLIDMETNGAKEKQSSLPGGKSDTSKPESSAANPKPKTVELKKDNTSKEDIDGSYGSEGDDDDSDDSEDDGERSGSEDDGERSGSEDDDERSGSEDDDERSGSEDDDERSGSEDDDERSGSEDDDERSGSEDDDERSGSEDDDGDNSGGEENICSYQVEGNRKGSANTAKGRAMLQVERDIKYLKFMYKQNKGLESVQNIKEAVETHCLRQHYRIKKLEAEKVKQLHKGINFIDTAIEYLKPNGYYVRNVKKKKVATHQDKKSLSELNLYLDKLERMCVLNMDKRLVQQLKREAGKHYEQLLKRIERLEAEDVELLDKAMKYITKGITYLGKSE